MADAQNIEKSIAEWQSKLEDPESTVSREVVEEILKKLRADLAQAQEA